MTDMTDGRSFATLSSSLLARKGQARPAMRPQALQIQNNSEASHAILNDLGLDDLGWNDMGHDIPHAGIPDVAPVGLHGITPLPHAEVPPVVHQQDALADYYAPDSDQQDEPAPLPLSGINPGFVSRTAVDPQQPVVRAAPGGRAKSAFTLRLDTARHLHLRLVCAVAHRSAQQIVTQALDEFLARQPSAAELASPTQS